MTETIPLSHRYLLRFCRGRTNHDIISREIKTAKSPWTKYARKLMISIKKWYSLQPARIYTLPFEHRMIHIADARIDIRLWIEFEEMRYDELSSPEVDEPVTDDGDTLVRKVHL
jgi:hypothetical protein